ncbi:MAG: DNA gyrase inhibitor YacG [Candidatus Brocadiaceae bacterium]|nr:DNA gyrase inhibitor YacG [Candidatus Brocadiaceae bacterium]
MQRSNCPICKKELVYRHFKDIPYYPFCGERCKLIDLGSWMDGSYCIEEPMSAEDLFTRKDRGGTDGAD